MYVVYRIDLLIFKNVNDNTHTMTNLHYSFRGIFFLFVFIFIRLSANATENELKIFWKVSEKLHSLKSISYQYKREFIYPAEDYHSKSEGKMYINFGKENDLAGFRFQYKDKEGSSVFNNSEFFDTLEDNMTIRINRKVKLGDFEGMSAIYNSIITLRNILPAIIKDKNSIKQVKDTLIGKKMFYLLNIQTNDKLPNYLGTDFNITTEKITFFNKVIVDKKTFLPVSFIQLKKGSRDINRTEFANIMLNPTFPAENSWYYSTYLKKYKPEKIDTVKIIGIGQNAPDFILDENATGKEVSLNQFQGKLVLLEFWIKNCSYCINAVDQLNKLNTKYKSSGLKLLAINTTDSKKSTDEFVSRHKVNYDILSGNPLVNKNYGISAFPQMVLIDKKGIVIYSGDFNSSTLDSLININL